MNMKGFTLVETMISMLILSVVLLGVYGVLNTGQKVCAKDFVLLEVQEQARNAMARIVKDVRQSSAATITVISASNHRLTFTIPSATGVQYYLNGTNLVREFPAGTMVNVASNIGLLTFTQTGTILQIQVRADKAFFSSTTSFSLVEKVRLRNE